jgi:hypothetical protein
MPGLGVEAAVLGGEDGELHVLGDLSPTTGMRFCAPDAADLGAVLVEDADGGRGGSAFGSGMSVRA